MYFYDYRKLFMSLFFTKFVKLDPDPHSEKLLDPDPQKMNADPQPCFCRCVPSPVGSTVYRYQFARSGVFPIRILGTYLTYILKLSKLK